MSRHETKRGLRIAMGVFSGLSAVNFGLSLAGALHEAAGRDQQIVAAATTEGDLVRGLQPPIRRRFQPRLKTIDTLLAEGFAGNHPDQALKEEQQLVTDITAIKLTAGEWTLVKGVEQNIAAGQSDQLSGNAFGASAVVSLITAGLTGGYASGVFRRD